MGTSIFNLRWSIKVHSRLVLLKLSPVPLNDDGKSHVEETLWLPYSGCIMSVEPTARWYDHQRYRQLLVSLQYIYLWFCHKARNTRQDVYLFFNTSGMKYWNKRSIIFLNSGSSPGASEWRPISLVCNDYDVFCTISGRSVHFAIECVHIISLCRLELLVLIYQCPPLRQSCSHHCYQWVRILEQQFHHWRTRIHVFIISL